MENSEIKNTVHGYKVFNPDWTCIGFQYEVGKIYEMDDPPVCCSRGFHFCTEAADCFEYYSFEPQNKVAEVIALGTVDYKSNDSKCCTNKIQIVREIPWDEVLRIVNIGKNCTGLRNTGNWNTGNRNTGDKNTGNENTGNRNTGDKNTGNWNTGDKNTGNENTGNWNTGNRNTGDKNTGNENTGNRNTGDKNTGSWNTGDWNQSSFNTGCFMTEEQEIFMFNKPSGWTYTDWLSSDACYLLNQIPQEVVEWIYAGDMTEEEKAEHQTYKTTGGYLRVLDKSESVQLWWDGLSDSEKETIKAMPNFDPEVFKACTGIKVDG